VNGHEEFIQDQDTGIQGGSGTGVHEAPFLAVPRQADPSFARRDVSKLSRREGGIGFKFFLILSSSQKFRQA
jgi:hypothetical protein